MNGAGSFVFSLAAMMLSAVTFYLTYFDERYTLTAAIDSVQAGGQTGASSSDERRSVSYRYFAEPSFILSHQGTRPLALTQLDLVKSTSPDRCVASEDTAFPIGKKFEPLIIEPGSVRRTAIEFSLDPIEAEALGTDELVVEPRSELWCLKLTLFDHRGERREPLLEAFSHSVEFTPAEDDQFYPDTVVDIDFPRHSVTLASSSLF